MNSQISPAEAAEEILKRRKARKNFADYCRYISPDELPAEHHIILCDALEEIIDGDIRNLMVFMPPGSAKSTYATVKFPAYYLGRMKKKSIISASYSGDLATDFGRKVRNLIDSPEHQKIFPDQKLTGDQKAKNNWETETGGIYKAVGVEGAITGRRADCGQIDDPVKGRKEADSDTVKRSTWDWYNTDFLTRIKPGGCQIIIQTRWSDDDLSGRILPENWEGESGRFVGRDGKMWTVISIQAECIEGKNDPLKRKQGEWLWPEWFTKSFWNQTKTAQMKSDPRNWQALYQQMPTTAEGSFFKRDWFRRYNPGDEPKRLSKLGASDYAVTADGGDYTEQGVAGMCPDGNMYMLDWISCQEESDVWVDDLLDLVKKHHVLLWGAEVGQIKKAVAPWLRKQCIKRKIYIELEPMPHIGDKATNARTFQAMAKMGLVYIPKNDWGEELIRQLVKFPNGAFDDKVDACGIMGRLAARAQISTTEIMARSKVRLF